MALDRVALFLVLLPVCTPLCTCSPFLYTAILVVRTTSSEFYMINTSCLGYDVMLQLKGQNFKIRHTKVRY